mmetsp:Transcript_31096/g.57881  ORF Transcript_31096/g.57881 Transcript_31096/m.57881 type:complete len:181 (-) Transcript_31096:32-574(-)
MLVEVMRRQHAGEHRHIGGQLHVHQRLDDGLADEVMSVDAAVHDEAAGNDGIKAAAARQALGMQRDFEGAGHLDHADLLGWDSTSVEFMADGRDGHADDVLVPAGGQDGHPRQAGQLEAGKEGLIHGVLLKDGFPESGQAHAAAPHLAKTSAATQRDLFHPDCDRRPWLCTRSADPSPPG